MTASIFTLDGRCSGSTRPLRRTDRPEDLLDVAPHQPAPGVMVLRVTGELDLATAPRLDSALDQALSGVAAEVARPDGGGPVPAEAPYVLCDLQGVAFLSAAGIAALLRAGATADALGVRFVVEATHRAVRRPFELTGVEDRLVWTRPPVG